MRVAVLAAIAMLALSGRADAEERLFDADGYRITHYRAPVGDAPTGTRRISAEEAADLARTGDTLFIDVLPAEGGHREPSGRWRLARPHLSIPGAHWFPETGRGDATPDMQLWLERGVRRLTHGEQGRRLVVFCLSDCWMSWNAARRLAARGYTNVWWFAEGTDGWRDLGLPLTEIVPEAD